MKRLSPALAALAALASSCGPEGAPSGDLPRSAPALAAGPAIAEPALNGTLVAPAPAPAGPVQTDSCPQEGSRTGAPRPYGCFPNGPLLASPLAWVSLGSASAAGGSPLESVTVDGGGLSGSLDGVPVQGADFVGAQFTGASTGGGSVLLRIDSAEAGSGAQADVWRYGFSYQGPTGEWHALCAGGAPAVVVLGRWDYAQGVPGGGSKTNDPTVFTAGCQGSAIEKCVSAGYKPWASAGGVSLEAHHQACVRLIRADFCGDGVSHTTEGKKVNLHDALGVQADTHGWLMEAEWTPAGARCVNLLNRSLLGVLCAPPLGTVTCGATSHFATGTLLMSETPLGPLGGLLSGQGLTNEDDESESRE